MNPFKVVLLIVALLKRKLTLKYILILDKDLIEKGVLKRQVAVSIIREYETRRVIIMSFFVFYFFQNGNVSLFSYYKSNY